MEQLSDIKLLAFDADDTLWDCQCFFDEVSERYCDLLAHYGEHGEIGDALFNVEMGNMEELGYGSKAFVISLVENALRVSNYRISARETEEIIAHKHMNHEMFGAGEKYNEKHWNPVIRQALIAGYLKKDVENYGLLKITSAGKKFLKNPTSFMIVEDKEFAEDYEAVSEHEGGTSALDPTLSAMLKDLRKKVSKQLDRPPYVIFQDVSIEQMATDYPVTLEELKNIQGVGEGKVKQPYAKEFVELIKKYCEENEIVRHSDLRVRTVAKKSILKVKIIQAIDRQIALDDIAAAQGLEFEELLDEVEAIVYSGTKLNIDYFLEEVMDEDHVDDIYDYFAESDSDSLEAAINELGDECTEDEIRLVRIKFISEMAN